MNRRSVWRPARSRSANTVRCPLRNGDDGDVRILEALREQLVDDRPWQDMAIRTRWVATLLDDRATGGDTAAQFGEALRRALRPEGIDELRRALNLGAEAIRSESHGHGAEATTVRPVSGLVQCWACRAPLAVTAGTRGKKVACPRCGRKQALPR